MLMTKKKAMKIATCIALLHLLCGHNTLNLTNYSVSVGCCHFYVLRRANGQQVCYSVTSIQLCTLMLSVIAYVVCRNFSLIN